MKWKERFLLVMLFVAILVLLVNRRNLNQKITIPIVEINEELLKERRSSDIAIDFMKLNLEENGIGKINLGKDFVINKNLDIKESKNSEDLHPLWNSMHPWDIWQDMVKSRRITSKPQKHVNVILKAMMSSQIIQVDKGFKGTQLKAVFYLDGPEHQKVVFKPKRYSRDIVLSGTPYEGYDRHNAEIAAFHLDRVLGFFRAPPAAGRYVNLKTQIIPVCKKPLLATFFHEGKNICFFGKCMYCNKDEPACANGEVMEGSLTLWIPSRWSIGKMRHPWQRTYKEGKKAAWEKDMDYCRGVVAKPPYSKGPRLLDIMDTAIFDFLIGNADRHHYEYLKEVGGTDTGEGMLLHLDNGKSFGNPHKDEISILAPIYQCCRSSLSRSRSFTLNHYNYYTTSHRLRKSTYLRLMEYSIHTQSPSSLSSILNSALKDDPIYPVITQAHLEAIDRRLKIVFDTLKSCFDKKGKEKVLLPDHFI